MMSSYKTTKTNVLNDEAAPLATWLEAYPAMANNPRAWLRGYRPTEAEQRHTRLALLFRPDGSFRDADEMRRLRSLHPNAFRPDGALLLATEPRKVIALHQPTLESERAA